MGESRSTLGAPRRATSFGPAEKTCVAVVLGIGLLLGSIWSSRGQSVFGSAVFLPAGRAVAAVLLPVWAYALSRRPVAGPALLAVAGAAAAGHIVCLLFARFWAQPESLAALGFAASVFDGVLITLALPCLLGATLNLGGVQARLSIALGLALATMYDLVFANLGQAVALAQWAVADVAVVALCRACLRAGGHAEGARAADAEEDGRAQAERAGKAADSLPRAWAVATALGCALMLVQGIVVQATGYGGAGNGSRFGIEGDIISFTTRVLVILYCAFSANGPRPLPWAAALTLAWCVALPATVLAWGTDAAQFGELLLEAGYNTLQAVILLWAYDVACEHRDRAHQVFCLAGAAMLANQLTRVAGLLAMGAPTGTDFAAVAAASVTGLGALAALAAAALPLLAASRDAAPLAAGGAVCTRAGRACAQAEAGAALGASAGAAGESASFAAQEADFCRRFEATCDERGLTQREREVLFTAIHGYTIDNIAERLCISRETVKSNLARAYARAGVNGKQAFLALMDERP